MTDDRHSTVPVPENAVRDEPLAFGLSGVQLGVLAAAALAVLVINLVPLPGPLRLLLALVTAGPIIAAAILPIAGRPAYHWLNLLVRYRTTNRVWTASLASSDKSQLSGEEDTDRREPLAMPTSPDPRPPEPPDHDPAWQDDAGEERPAPVPLSGSARLRLVEPDDAADLDDPVVTVESDVEAPIPHLVAGLRVITVLSFAGGVGKTTLAVELASLLAARGRYRTLDGAEHALAVLVVDAARQAPAAGLRLGLDPASLARLPQADWTIPDAVERHATVSRCGVAVVALPAQLPLDGTEGLRFGATAAAKILDGADRAGYGLVIVDLGGVHEEGHRHLIDQSALVIGVVRSTIESIPDVLRLATYLRGLGMGRKLVLVANGTDDDHDLRRLAADADVPILGRIGPSEAISLAADRGDPAWTLDPALDAALVPIASAIWPLTGAVGRPRLGVGAALARVRTALLGGGR